MKRSSLKWILGIAALCVLASGISLVLSSYSLTVSRYSVPAPALANTVRIVHLTDLHNSEFGTQNQRLIEKVTAEDPDLIMITGDLLNYKERRTDIAENLISYLASIAPVCVSYGNHEAAYEKIYSVDLRELYTRAGATVLEYDWTEITVKGQELRLGGIYGYCLPPEYEKSGEARSRETAFMRGFQETERYSILMCHMPYSWLTRNALDGWDVDLVLCGHVHGGQVRLPFVGGLWAPDQGWFPGIESGLYWSEDRSKVMLLSRGLGNVEILPRFNNIPEIVVVDLLPTE